MTTTQGAQEGEPTAQRLGAEERPGHGQHGHDVRVAYGARGRIEALTKYWENKYGVKATWSGNRAHAKGSVKGITFDATVDVAAGTLVCESELNFIMARIAGPYIEKKIDEYLDASKKLDALPLG